MKKESLYQGIADTIARQIKSAIWKTEINYHPYVPSAMSME